MSGALDKTLSFTQFLKAFGNLRRQVRRTYEKEDLLVRLGDLRSLPESFKTYVRSPSTEESLSGDTDFWLKVQRVPRRPPLLPSALGDCVSAEELRNPNREPSILPDCIKDLEAEKAWQDYLENIWKPWAEALKTYEKLYQDLDRVYDRLEQTRERYEFLLGIGLLQWRDPDGQTIKRHLLVAPAEIRLELEQGVFTVEPGEKGFRLELDMLDPAHRPRLREEEKRKLEELLVELSAKPWDREGTAQLLRFIAHGMSGQVPIEVHEDEWSERPRADETFRILYAPALILRERRLAGYAEILEKLEESFENGTSVGLTAPWKHLIEVENTQGLESGEGAYRDTDHRLYFPLPTNDEQEGIIESLRQRPYVLVKGPPGTGKSHTIANLITHLLAKGERLLVTAHSPRALQVLHGLLPKSIRSLGLMTLGSDREEREHLERNIEDILKYKDNWREERAQQRIRELESQILDLEKEKAGLERRLREYREAETYSHTLPGGYTGTRAQNAKRLEEEKGRYGWFPELLRDGMAFPLSPDEVEFLCQIHPTLTQERLGELQGVIGDFSLPKPDEFQKVLEDLAKAERDFQTTRQGLDEVLLRRLEDPPQEVLQAFRGFLEGLEEHLHLPLAEQVLGDWLQGRLEGWLQLEQEVADLERGMRELGERVKGLQVILPQEVPEDKLRLDVRRRLEHFKQGGKRGWGILAPRVVRETQYLEKTCRVNGAPPTELPALGKLYAFLELKGLLKRFGTKWPEGFRPLSSDPIRASIEATDLVKGLRGLLQFLEGVDRSVLEVVPKSRWLSLKGREGREEWNRLLEAELARRRLEGVRAQLGEWHRLIRSVRQAHPSMGELARAIEERDPALWQAAYQERERIRQGKKRYDRYLEILARIQGSAPSLAELLRSTQGAAEWQERLRDLERAWYWASAGAWLRRVTDPEQYESDLARSRELENKIKQTIEKLAAWKAWQAFFHRLDDEAERNLKAWKKSMDRLGKGTGKYAYKHRREAREYLEGLVPKIPLWIMPLHKLWETVQAEPGVFDTVIVDEASQAGVDALLLFLLAKRIIIVGDDKQNSPEGVGIGEHDIERLQRDYLRDFSFREQFRPDASLYDIAYILFKKPLSLREHFRCVPEIIRFSNEHFYNGELIPLRQPPPSRLPPLRAVFVEGKSQGESQWINNELEAEAIVKRIEDCLQDAAYRGKTMGVIVLQGRSQVSLIERRLSEELDPKVREERRLRVGVPSDFQGDERDVIFLSMVVGPNHSYRALTGRDDERRYNVAMSRAREQVWLFHSVQLGELSPKDLRYKLLHYFQTQGRGTDGVYEELQRLEKASRNRRRGEQPEPYDSWFEVDVAMELLKRGYRVRPQVEFGGYRIDLVVEGLDKRLAVECDGEAWHGPERYDQDMRRQRQLERAGWIFVRIRESEFYVGRARAVERVIQACEELGISPVRA